VLGGRARESLVGRQLVVVAVPALQAASLVPISGRTVHVRATHVAHHRPTVTAATAAAASLRPHTPSYLQNAICPVARAESRRHRAISSCRRPRDVQQWAQDRAFAVAAPRASNSLPDAIRRSPSLAVFKRSLKTHFYNIQCFY